MIDYELFSNMTIQEDVLKLRIENEQLKQQIEKMKCCYNCEGYIDDDAYDLCKICNAYSEWELAE